MWWIYVTRDSLLTIARDRGSVLDIARDRGSVFIIASDRDGVLGIARVCIKEMIKRQRVTEDKET